MKNNFFYRLIPIAILVLFLDRAIGIHLLFVAFFVWWLARAEHYSEYIVLLMLSLFHDVQYQLPLGLSGGVLFGSYYLSELIFRKRLLSRRGELAVLIVINSLLLLFLKLI